MGKKDKETNQAKVSPEKERSFTVFDQTTLALRLISIALRFNSTLHP